MVAAIKETLSHTSKACTRTVMSKQLCAFSSKHDWCCTCVRTRHKQVPWHTTVTSIITCSAKTRDLLVVATVAWKILTTIHAFGSKDVNVLTLFAAACLVAFGGNYTRLLATQVDRAGFLAQQQRRHAVWPRCFVKLFIDLARESPAKEFCRINVYTAYTTIGVLNNIASQLHMHTMHAHNAQRFLQQAQSATQLLAASSARADHAYAASASCIYKPRSVTTLC